MKKNSAIFGIYLGIFFILFIMISTMPVSRAETGAGSKTVIRLWNNGISSIADFYYAHFWTVPQPQSIEHDVPFTPQAPFGNWDDPRKQDGCEEASVLMAMKWINGNDLTLKEAEEEINALADFQDKEYENYQDTSAEDTAIRLLDEYYGHTKYRVKHDINSKDIKEELLRGNLVIAPMNGQALQNPYFTPPGPEYHMVLFVGYLNSSNMFVVHDPGTKRGEAYLYSPEIIDFSLRDYPTGHHEPIIGTETAMIVVWK